MQGEVKRREAAAGVKRRRLMLGSLALGGALLAAWAWRPRPLVVDVGEVALGRYEQVVEEDGRLRVARRYVVTAPAAGELLRPELKVGDAVQADQVVARLLPASPALIDERSRRMLAERVGMAAAARAAAAAQVERQRASLAQAEIDAERAQRLADERFIADAARDQALLSLQVQRRAWDASRADLAAAEHALAEARAALSPPGPARPKDGPWNLRAPVSGRVIRLPVESAQPVGVGQALVELGDTGRLEAVIDVLSADALRLGPGTPVQLSAAPGLPALPGRVARVEPVATTKVSALGIEEQRVNVIVELDNGSAMTTLGDGYRVEARLTAAAHDGALLVPSAALVRDGAQWVVMVVQDGRARLRVVTLKARHGEQAWVDTGLQAGEQVVLYPGVGIVDGQPVTPRKQGTHLRGSDAGPR